MLKDKDRSCYDVNILIRLYKKKDFAYLSDMITFLGSLHRDFNNFGNRSHNPIALVLNG